MMKRQFFKNLALSALFLGNLSATEWGHVFRDSSAPSVPFVGGTLFPARDNSFDHLGYVLTSVSRRGSGAEEEIFPGLTRFDADGNALWSVHINAEEGTNFTQPELVAATANLTHFNASVNETTPLVGTTAFRIGRVRGADQEPVFAKRLTKLPNNPHQVEFFRSDLFGATIDKGATLESVVYDELGEEVYHKTYSSSFFQATDGFVTQSFVRALTPDDSAYVTSVAQSGFEFVDGVVTQSTEIVPFYTDLNGEVTQASSFGLDFLATGVPFPTILGDGSLLYRILGSETFGPGGPGGQETTFLTHLVKLKRDGSLAWAKSIPFGNFFGVFPTEDSIYLSGSVSTSGPAIASSKAAILQLDFDTGEIISQASFDSIADLDSASIMVNESNVYATITASTVAGNPGGNDIAVQSILVKMSRDLQIESAVEYLPPHQGGVLIPEGPIPAADRFVFSPANEATGEIVAITLDANLQPVLDCEFIRSATVSLDGTIALRDLAVTEGAATVTATDATSLIEDTTLPVSTYQLAVEQSCDSTSNIKRLTISRSSSGDGLVISFPTEDGVTYTLSRSSNLSNFSVLETVGGDGTAKTIDVDTASSGGYFVVSPIPPGSE